MSVAMAVIVLSPSEPRETPDLDHDVVPVAVPPLTVTELTVPGEVSAAVPETVTELFLV